MMSNTRALKPAWLIAIALLFPVMGFAAAETTAVRVELSLRHDRPGAKINRELYGQFAEHLGRGIYEGIWVGEDSKIPNTRGFRNDVLAALKELRIPVIRWPGGCFADEYHWRDGIGPRSARPVRVNTNWGSVEENNAFGTHEYFDLVEMLGAQAYIAGNLGTGSPHEMAEWLEYITSDSHSTLAELRRKNGRDKPWKIAYWGVGNESWGCGGNMRPEHYADLYRNYTSFLKTPNDNHPQFVASGGYNDLTVWTEVLAKNIPSNIDGISHHYYTIPTSVWEKKGSATGFPEEEWISTLEGALKMDGYIQANRKILEKRDPDNKVKLYVDEWGTWYDPAPGVREGSLYQENTLRDALVAAINFTIFHKHADRVRMANIAQTVNVLQAMILTDGAKMVRTPTYYAFKMHLPFQDATFLPVEIKKSARYMLGGHEVPSAMVTAALGRDGKIHIALTNLDPNKAAAVAVDLQGYAATVARGLILTADRMDAANTFDRPDNVKPRPVEYKIGPAGLHVDLPPKSFVVLSLESKTGDIR
ncbi:MAG TPA: alpha-L-arabinofuranosidase C-terminal domain-containing protein [Gammaproteobacteria bacterium]|nr:alpha-L-arabinofuranosidase C-terminal domain-containing protein [Gammaproteobacteria bacterium]